MDEYSDEYWRERARDQYGSDDVMVYEDATVDDSPEDGVWVTAYVWVARPELDECEDDEDDEDNPVVDPAGVCEWMDEDDPMKYR